MFKEYKANRDTTPEDIKIAVPYIKEILEAYKIPIIEKLGYEADDVVGTIAKHADKEGFTVYMMTPDKDYMQLVDEKILMYKPARSGNDKEIIGIEEVKEKFGIESPIQVIDILALWGDSSDNVPGAPGIGEKTAKQLIEKYKTVENLLNSTHELKGKQKENLENYKEQIELSKKLVTIITDVPIDLNIDDLKISEPNKEKLSALFDKLDFRNLKKRIIGESNKTEVIQGSLFDTAVYAESQPKKSEYIFNSSEVQYKLITELNDLDKFIKASEKEEIIVYDTETTGLNVFSDRLLGIALAIREKEAFYVEVTNENQAKNLVEKLNVLFNNSSILKIGHNLKFDMQVLCKYGAKFKGPLFDTMVGHYLIKPEGRHKLDDVVNEYFGYQMIPIEELIEKRSETT
jgi:DNA polymerase-1